MTALRFRLRELLSHETPGRDGYFHNNTEWMSLFHQTADVTEENIIITNEENTLSHVSF